MTSRDFCFWLQGCFEISPDDKGLSPEQVKIVKNHLALVFQHEIDPSMGDAAHQQTLDDTHSGKPPFQRPQGPGGTVLRC